MAATVSAYFVIISLYNPTPTISSMGPHGASDFVKRVNEATSSRAYKPFPFPQGKLRSKRGKNLMWITQCFQGTARSSRPLLPPRTSPASCCPTCINVAVPQGMDGMLAFTPTLAKELGGQGLGHWEGLRLGGVTYVHHLVGCVQGLVAALVVLPEALQQGSVP